MKIVVYTAIFGDYSGLIEQPIQEGVDYICYTDQNLKSKIWEVKKIDLPVENDNTRSNRYLKILAHKHLQEYDYSVYIDSNVLVIGDIKELVNKYLYRYPMACFDHNQNFKDPRDCIYDEYEAIIKLGEKKGKYKHDPEVMKKQMDFVKQQGYPEHNGLISASTLVRKHNDPTVIQLMEDWWNLVNTQSRRDQLSFNYVAWKNSFTYEIIPGDVRKGNVWVCMLGGHKKNYWKKILKYRIKKLLRIN